MSDIILKLIKDDDTFGPNYAQDMRQEYEKSGAITEDTRLLEMTLDQALVIDNDPNRYMYKEGIPGIFLGYPAGVVERPEYAQEKFESDKELKYFEITQAYDYANTYGIVPLEGSLFGNAAWIPTWTKVITLCQGQGVTILPSKVRLYKRETTQGKFKNIQVENMPLETLKGYLFKLNAYQFTVLQPRRNELYALLENTRTSQEVASIKADFGETLNEQDQEDVTSKIEV